LALRAHKDLPSKIKFNSSEQWKEMTPNEYGNGSLIVHTLCWVLPIFWGTSNKRVSENGSISIIRRKESIQLSLSKLVLISDHGSNLRNEVYTEHSPNNGQNSPGNNLQ
jgi:hypothetical protein